MPTVGVTADRRGEDQALLFTRLGFDVLLGPAMQTVMLTDDGPLRTVTDALVADPPDFLVANTGIGIRTWLAAARDWDLEAPLLAALAGAHIAARGPKAAGAIRSAGLEVRWRAASEQLAEVAGHLVAAGVNGKTVAVQRHGVDDADFGDRLRAAGAEVIDVPVYRWAVPEDSRAALTLIEAVIAGRVDAVTFTSGPAARNLVGLARQVGLAADLLAALNGDVLVACVGPVCAGVAHDEGIVDVAVPDAWRLGSLVRLVADELTRRAATG